MAPWANCVLAKIRELDDGSSAVMGAAYAIRAQCRRLWIGTTEAELPLIVGAVERSRASKRGEPYVASDFVPAAQNRRSTSMSSTPMKKDRGTYVVPVVINNTITLDFTVDSGASDVTIPLDVVKTLIDAGTIREADLIGEKTYVIADGSKVKSVTFRIRSLKVGDRIVENVIGSIGPAKGPLLLGQSFLGRFKSWSIDNNRHALVLE